MTSNGNRKINRKRLLYSVTPLVVMLLIIIGLNFLPRTASEPQPTVMAGTAVSSQPSTIPSTTSTRPPILPATILPSPTPTITPRPNVAPEAAITLSGPPNESSLPLNGRITFYWQYSELLLPGQALVFTLRQDDTVIATSSLNQPNFGDGYQVLVAFEDIAEAGTAVWQVRLQWEDESSSLLTSDNRTITLLSE
ncbi:hypothetical protein [Candidatus Leptofilum sp.]|uniref:hypothetical protein n=1 Tax=Candidatus Leptofilum sp. TaxID=3241576 RepID=UPI003B5A426A